MPIDVIYQPGARFLAVGPKLAVLSSDRALIERMWPVVCHGGDTAAVLVDALGAGLASLADLVLIEGSADHVELLVRGEIDVVVHAAGSGPERVDGRGVRTWRECAFERLASIDVMPGADGADGFALQCGIVRADGFRWAPRDGHPGAVPSADAPPATMPRSDSEPAAPVAEQPAPQPTVVPARDEPRVSADSLVSPGLPTPPVVPVDVPAEPPASQQEPVAPIPSPSATPVAPPPASVDGVAGGPGPAPEVVRAARHHESDAGATRLADEDDEYGHLFESTILRTSEDAAVRIDPEDVDEAAAPVTAVSPQLGDHDGETILGSQLAAALAASGLASSDVARSVPALQLGDHDGETILGSQLTAALAAARGQGAAVPPPPPPNVAAAMELVFSTGEVVLVDGPVVIGRKPQAARFTGAHTPKMVTVTGPNNDISRSHLEITPEGDHLLATDLGSTNGTILQGAAGTRPLTAHAPEPCGVGSRLDLGDGVIIDVRTAR